MDTFLNNHPMFMLDIFIAIAAVTFVLIVLVKGSSSSDDKWNEGPPNGRFLEISELLDEPGKIPSHKKVLLGNIEELNGSFAGREVKIGFQYSNKILLSNSKVGASGVGSSNYANLTVSAKTNSTDKFLYVYKENGEKGSKPKGYKRVRLDNDLLVGLKLYSKDGQEVSSWLSDDVIKHMIDLFHIGGYDQILVSENLIESKAIIPSASMVEKEKVSENLKALSLMAEAIDQS